jgi:hypothetical protein
MLYWQLNLMLVLLRMVSPQLASDEVVYGGVPCYVAAPLVNVGIAPIELWPASGPMPACPFIVEENKGKMERGR